MLATRSERREEINANLSHAKKQGRIRRVDKIPFAAFSTSKHPDLAKTKCDRRKKHFGRERNFSLQRESSTSREAAKGLAST
jgi:hypothetical protein